jgi:hypothetical protein
VTRRLVKNLPNFSKLRRTRVTRKIVKNCQFFLNAPKVAKSKKGQNIYNKAQFECSKHIQQTTFETLKYLQKTYFESAYLGENIIKLLKQKVAIILGYFILSKNHNKPPKVTQLAKNRTSGHPVKN